MSKGDWGIVGLGVLVIGAIVVSTVLANTKYHAKRVACLEEMGRAGVSPARADEVCP